MMLEWPQIMYEFFHTKLLEWPQISVMNSFFYLESRSAFMLKT